MEVGRRRGYANAKEEPSGPSNSQSQHAFLTRRCHDFRTMASIYMSHLYTRIPRCSVPRCTTFAHHGLEDLPRTLRPIKSREWKSIQREPGHPLFNAPLIPNSSNCFVRTSFLVQDAAGKCADRRKEPRLVSNMSSSLMERCITQQFVKVGAELVRDVSIRWRALGRTWIDLM